jgi:GMP synthase (glutamine-hydrolysing)
MSAWEDDRYPWLSREKRFIETFVNSGKPVLGVCLGAQILADVLGARIYPGPHKEIGWFAAEVTPEGRQTWIGGLLPDRFETFLWHGDTFDLPDGAVRIARSAAFENQGFIWRQTLALQFHLEVHPEWVRMLTRRDAQQLVEAAYVQRAETILAKPMDLYHRNNALMESLLRRWLDQPRPSLR